MAFEEWFRSKQGEPYSSMWDFAKDAFAAVAGGVVLILATKRRKYGMKFFAAARESGEWNPILEVKR